MENTSYQFLKVVRTGRITRITLNRPDALNALHPLLYQELVTAYDQFCNDPEQWVGILSGTGRGFCAGVDLKYATDAKSQGRKVSDEFNACGRLGLLERHDVDKPMIAAINGIAMGGGFELALACDLIIAAETAVFALPEPRVGAIAQGGGPHRLARQIGLKQAMGMVLTGRRVTAEEGLRLGFVNESVAATELDAAAERWAGSIIECAPLAVRASKEMVMRGLDAPSLAEAIRHQAEYPAFGHWARSEEATQGAGAFAEHRLPPWRTA